jgi:DNA-binding transcriptional MocR family regulator
VEYVVIEDTGKIWPTLELKLGLLAFSEGCTLELGGAASDLLLTVSPFVLLLVERLAAEAADGGLGRLHALIAHNREILASALKGTGAAIEHPESRTSVALVRLPDGVHGQRLWRDLASKGLYVLPANAFFWAEPAEGDEFVRVALARDPDILGLAATELARAITALDARSTECVVGGTA